MDQPTAILIAAAIGFAGGLGSTFIVNAFQIHRERRVLLRSERKASFSTVCRRVIAVANTRAKALAEGRKGDRPDLSNLQDAIVEFRLLFSDEITEVSRAKFHDITNRFGEAIAAEDAQAIEARKWDLLNYVDSVSRKGLRIKEVTKWT